MELEDTSLREVVRRLVAELEAGFGPRLQAVWLYGSSARGERRGPESDVDLLVVLDVEALGDRSAVTSRAIELAWEGEDFMRVCALVRDLAWLADRRAIRSFFLGEVEQDRVVLSGAVVSPRDAELLEFAERRLAAARETVDVICQPELAAGGAYYAALLAARAALSSRDLHAKTHSGTWHLFRRELVRDGSFDAELTNAASALQDVREDVDDEGRPITREEAQAMLEVAERFVAAVGAYLR